MSSQKTVLFGALLLATAPAIAEDTHHPSAAIPNPPATGTTRAWRWVRAA
jgi:hypothetical protein